MKSISSQSRSHPFFFRMSIPALYGDAFGGHPRRAKRAEVAGAEPHGCERGAALVEFALSLPMLMLVFAGVADYALIIQKAMLLNQAAAAAAAYGVITGNNADLTGMQTAAQNNANGLSGMTVTASDIYSCTAGGNQVSSTTTCSGYGSPIKYVQIKTSITVQPLLGFPGIPSTFALLGSSSYRVQWTP